MIEDPQFSSALLSAYAARHYEDAAYAAERQGAEGTALELWQRGARHRVASGERRIAAEDLVRAAELAGGGRRRCSLTFEAAILLVASGDPEAARDLVQRTLWLVREGQEVLFALDRRLGSLLEQGPSKSVPAPPLAESVKPAVGRDSVAHVGRVLRFPR